MKIETVEELCEQLADWIGVYGACKDSGEETVGCENKNPCCCRSGFMMVMQDRIKTAVENDKKLESAKLGK